MDYLIESIDINDFRCMIDSSTYRFRSFTVLVLFSVVTGRRVFVLPK